MFLCVSVSHFVWHFSFQYDEKMHGLIYLSNESNLKIFATTPAQSAGPCLYLLQKRFITNLLDHPIYMYVRARPYTRDYANIHPLHHSSKVSFSCRFPSQVYPRAVGLRATSSPLQFMKRISRTRYLAQKDERIAEVEAIGVSKIFWRKPRTTKSLSI